MITVLDILMAESVLDWQLVTVRALVATIALSFGVERAKMRTVALVPGIASCQFLQQFATGAVGFAKVDCARGSVLELALDILSVVLAIDVGCRSGSLHPQCGIADLGRQAELKVEQAGLTAVLGLGASLANLRLLVPAIDCVSVIRIRQVMTSNIPCT